MRLFRPASAHQTDLALTILRVVTGIIFLAHGSQKLFVFGLGGVAGAFGQMGIPLAGFVGPAVAFLEFFGGLALIAGLLTRLASFGLVVNMLGALAFVHLKGGFFLPNGYEFVLVLLGALTALLITGGGPYTLDALIARRGVAAENVRPVRRAA
jgi:putative oxidoreductase